MKQKINDLLKQAMRNKDALACNVLRDIKGEVQKFETAVKYKGSTCDKDIEQIISTMVKQRYDAIKMFKQGNRLDLVEQNENEITILDSFLPTKVTGNALATVVSDTILKIGATGPSDMGKVMGAVKQTGIAFDGKELSGNVKFQLGQL
jgi:hypothetical protein